jgi:hypothetical protein
MFYSSGPHRLDGKSNVSEDHVLRAPAASEVTKLMTNIHFFPGTHVRLRTPCGVPSQTPTTGIVLRVYASLTPWYDVQLDDHPTTVLYAQDDLELAKPPCDRVARAP